MKEGEKIIIDVDEGFIDASILPPEVVLGAVLALEKEVAKSHQVTADHDVQDRVQVPDHRPFQQSLEEIFFE